MNPENVERKRVKDGDHDLCGGNLFAIGRATIITN